MSPESVFECARNHCSNASGIRTSDYIGLEHHFSMLQGGDDVQVVKPHPEGLNRIIDELQLQKDQVIYVGDSIIDAKTADNAKVPFIGVTTGHTTKDQLQSYPHLAVLENLIEIAGLLRSYYR